MHITEMLNQLDSKPRQLILVRDDHCDTEHVFIVYIIAHMWSK